MEETRRRTSIRADLQLRHFFFYVFEKSNTLIQRKHKERHWNLCASDRGGWIRNSMNKTASGHLGIHSRDCGCEPYFIKCTVLVWSGDLLCERSLRLKRLCSSTICVSLPHPCLYLERNWTTRWKGRREVCFTGVFWSFFASWRCFLQRCRRNVRVVSPVFVLLHVFSFLRR